MIYNILPNGMTCLHKFVENDQPDDVAELFKLSQANTQDIKDITYHVPIIRNYEHKSALHVAKD